MAKTVEGIFLILKDFNIGTNIYSAGTLANKIPAESPKSNYIKYSNEEEMLNNVENHLGLIAQYRNDVNLNKFKTYLKPEVLDTYITKQKISSRVVGYINRLVLREKTIAVAVIEKEGKYYGIRRTFPKNLDPDLMPKTMINYLVSKLQNYSNPFIVNDMNIGYDTNIDNLVEHNNTYIHTPGSKNKYYYQFGIINHYLVTGEKLLPIKELG